MPTVNTAFSWGQRAFSPGDEVDAADPAVAKFPHLFDDEAPVERATARPGTRRATRRPNPRK
jgi:hypothetical protein